MYFQGGVALFQQRAEDCFGHVVAGDGIPYVQRDWPVLVSSPPQGPAHNATVIVESNLRPARLQATGGDLSLYLFGCHTNPGCGGHVSGLLKKLCGGCFDPHSTHCCIILKEYSDVGRPAQAIPSARFCAVAGSRQ